LYVHRDQNKHQNGTLVSKEPANAI